jgi:hypothetical protein
LIQLSNLPLISPLGAPAPPPLSEKPKWKPPPVVERVKPIDGEDDADAPQKARVPVIGMPAAAPVPAVAAEGSTTSPSMAAAESEEPIAAAGAVQTSVSPSPQAEEPSTDEAPVAAHEPNEEQAQAAEAEQAAEEDPEEAERQRRAAIAARMARLGGARVGMAPMFGGPPPIGKKPVPTPARKPSGEEGTLFIVLKFIYRLRLYTETKQVPQERVALPGVVSSPPVPHAAEPSDEAAPVATTTPAAPTKSLYPQAGPHSHFYLPPSPRLILHLLPLLPQHK